MAQHDEPDWHARERDDAEAFRGYSATALTGVVPSRNGESHQEREPTSWKPIDLSTVLDGSDVQPPTLLERTDGINLLYAGRTHQFAGESESLKSWAAQVAAAQSVTTGQHVLWIDYEDDERGVVSRLRALAVPTEQILTHFHYIRPDEPLESRDHRVTAGGLDFVDVLAEQVYSLAVIDGVTEAMTTEGLEMMDNSDVATWARRLPKRLADRGAAVVVIDHVTKNVEGRGRFAIGGQHKLAGLTGAAYRFDMIRPFSRAVTEPVEALVKITVMKDRPGYVRARAAEGVAAMLQLTSYPDGGVTAALTIPSSAPAPDLKLALRIIEYLTTYDGATKNSIENEIEGKAQAIREALRWMADPIRGWIRVEKSGQSHRHYLTDEGRGAIP